MLKCKGSGWVEPAKKTPLIMISHNPSPYKTKNKDKMHLNLLKRREKERKKGKEKKKKKRRYEGISLLENPKDKLIVCLLTVDVINQSSASKRFWTSFFPLFCICYDASFRKDVKKKLAMESRRGRAKTIIQAFSLAVLLVATVQYQNCLHADFQCSSDHTKLQQISSQEVEMLQHGGAFMAHSVHISSSYYQKKNYIAQDKWGV